MKKLRKISSILLPTLAILATGCGKGVGGALGKIDFSEHEFVRQASQLETLQLTDDAIEESKNISKIEVTESDYIYTSQTYEKTLSSKIEYNFYANNILTSVLSNSETDVDGLTTYTQGGTSNTICFDGGRKGTLWTYTTTDYSDDTLTKGQHREVEWDVMPGTEIADFQKQIVSGVMRQAPILYDKKGNPYIYMSETTINKSTTKYVDVEYINITKSTLQIIGELEVKGKVVRIKNFTGLYQECKNFDDFGVTTEDYKLVSEHRVNAQIKYVKDGALPTFKGEIPTTPAYYIPNGETVVKFERYIPTYEDETGRLLTATKSTSRSFTPSAYTDEFGKTHFDAIINVPVDDSSSAPLFNIIIDATAYVFANNEETNELERNSKSTEIEAPLTGFSNNFTLLSTTAEETPRQFLTVNYDSLKENQIISSINLILHFVLDYDSQNEKVVIEEFLVHQTYTFPGFGF